jgi:hypothetical protein
VKGGERYGEEKVSKEEKVRNSQRKLLTVP